MTLKGLIKAGRMLALFIVGVTLRIVVILSEIIICIFGLFSHYSEEAINFLDDYRRKL